MKMLGRGFGIVRAGRARWIGSLVNSVRIESCKASTQSLASHEAGMFTGTGEGGGNGVGEGLAAERPWRGVIAQLHGRRFDM